MLTIKQGYKTFNIGSKKMPILQNINLNVADEEFVSILGYSGCGKSTLLRVVAGLSTLDSGKIQFDGTEIIGPSIDRGMVFQDHRLLPWLTIQQNIAFGLDNIPKSQKKRLVDEYLSIINLSEFANAYPQQLSGGMSQRAAIARTIISHPKLVLLDEPLAALDALTKIILQQEILRIKIEKKLTILLVTHDIEEAIYFSHRVIIMSSRPGQIKKNITINLPFPRDRGSMDFAYYKKLILQEFFNDNKNIFLAEYNI